MRNIVVLIGYFSCERHVTAYCSDRASEVPLKAYSHRAKVEVKAKIFFDICRFL